MADLAYLPQRIRQGIMAARCDGRDRVTVFLSDLDGLVEETRRAARTAALREAEGVAKGRQEKCLVLAAADGLSEASGLRSPFFDRAMEASKIADAIAALAGKESGRG